ncbi:uncharacterized protein LOC131168565 [Malania oleifera]|uniref:uncharacterized protein LOC131168565 n=1 Tax=Malania oleifera TaxID=397392 RepID=UPI0025AE6B74|nr:uncharacterized protein LOC131168565 [Malania oleifera]
MVEGTPVKDRVLKMIGFLNELEILEAEINGETQVDIVLQSLPDSFKNLDIVLTAEEYKYVLIEVCSQKPDEGATDEETQAYWKWIKANEMGQCYILASMSNVLQHQHQYMSSAYDIMQNLTEMFRDQNRAARQTAMKELMNTTIAEGTPVRDHVLNMIGLLNELKIFGAEINGET